MPGAEAGITAAAGGFPAVRATMAGADADLAGHGHRVIGRSRSTAALDLALAALRRPLEGGGLLGDARLMVR